jgi:hypothetical protein
MLPSFVNADNSAWVKCVRLRKHGPPAPNTQDYRPSVPPVHIETVVSQGGPVILR